MNGLDKVSLLSFKNTNNRLSQTDTVDLCASAQLIRTPGPTAMSITVVAYNVVNFGTVAITGNLLNDMRLRDTPTVITMLEGPSALARQSKKTIVNS